MRIFLISVLAVACLVSLDGLLVAAPAPGAYGFVPNAGQWHPSIRYRAQGPYGQWTVGTTSWSLRSLDVEHHHGQDRPPIHPPAVKGHVLEWDWIGAQEPRISAIDSSYTRFNYYLGQDSTRWATDLHACRHLTMASLYRGIDLHLKAGPKQMKYELVVAPRTDPGAIAFRLKGADSIYTRNDGKELVILTSLGRYVERMPLVHQPDKPLSLEESRSATRSVPCRFVLKGDTVGFAFPEGFDPRYALIIDPEIVFSSASGIRGPDNWGFTGTYGPNGEAYSGGVVFSEAPDNYPTPGAFQRSYGGGLNDPFLEPYYGRDALIYKLSPNGTRAEYITYLGGRNNDQPHSMITNKWGELLILGFTYSFDFPVTRTGMDTTYSGRGDLYVVRLSANGSRMVSGTYLGGSEIDGINYGSETFRSIMRDTVGTFDIKLDYNYGDLFRGEINLDPSGRVLVASTTRSSNFDRGDGRIYGAYAGGGSDGFVAALSSNLSSLEYLRYLGGSDEDAAYSLASRQDGSVYVAGGTSSPDFAGLSGHQNQYQGGNSDGWLAHISPDGSRLWHGTYVGRPAATGYDQVFFVKTDRDDLPYVLGQTMGRFPRVGSVANMPGGGHFIARYSPDLSRQTLAMPFGRSNRPDVPALSPTAFLVDRCGRVYISGWGGNVMQAYDPGLPGDMAGFPTRGEGANANTDGSDFYLAVWSPGMERLEYATYLGAVNGDLGGDHVDGGTSRFDPQGVVYQSVCAACDGRAFPTTEGAFSGEMNESGCTNAIFKIDFEGPELLPGFAVEQEKCEEDGLVRFINQSEGAINYSWDFGDGTQSNEVNPTHRYRESGVYRVRLVVTNPNSCNAVDSLVRDVNVITKQESRLQAEVNCSLGVRLTYVSDPAVSGSWYWNLGDGTQTISSQPEIFHQFADTGQYLVQMIFRPDSSGVCPDTLARNLQVAPPTAAFIPEEPSCGFELALQNQSIGHEDQRWFFGDGATSRDVEPVHTYSDTGSYQVLLVINPDDPACRDSLTQSVYVAGFPDNDFTMTEDTCVSGATFQTTNPNEQALLWKLGDGSEAVGDSVFHNYRDTGRYEVLLITRPGLSCADSIRKTADIALYRFADWAIDTLLPCSRTLFTNNRSAQLTSSRWWVDDTLLVSREREPQIELPGRDTAILQLVAELSAGCRDSLSLRVEFLPLPQAAWRIDRGLCTNVFDLLARKPAGGFDTTLRYRWTFDDQPNRVIEDTAVRRRFFREGRYTGRLEVIDDLGCRDTSAFTLRVDTIPTADFSSTVQPCADSLRLTSKSTGAFSYQWGLSGASMYGSLSGDTSVSLPLGAAAPMASVFLIINPQTPCADTLRKEVMIPEDPLDALQIPNIFTPNGDGKNETWRIRWKVASERSNLSFCDPLQMRIYNRWGQIMYEIDDMRIPFEWDGNHKNSGKALPSGTYYYFIENNGRKREGMLVLTR